MTKRWTKTEAFAEFNAQVSNPRQSWSARSTDGKTVVLTFWKDYFSYRSKPISYIDDKFPDCVVQSPGNRERIYNIKWAIEHCGGVVSVVFVKARDETSIPREIEECYPQKKPKMRITKFNETTGYFQAEAVDALDQGVN